MEKVFLDNNIRLLGGGTSNHLLLADVFGSLGVTGKEAQTVLDEVGMTLNMNAIADDPRKPMDLLEFVLEHQRLRLVGLKKLIVLVLQNS